MSTRLDSLRFRENAAEAVKNVTLRAALRNVTDLLARKRNEGTVYVPMEEWKDRASLIRGQVLDKLESHLETFRARATAAGAVLHHAHDAQAAREIILGILRERDVKKVVKSKSMVTEEIDLNGHIEAHGIKVVETDLGEYIVQLAGETPSHILAPAIHKNRVQVGELFMEKLGVPFSDDPEVLTRIARDTLRSDFLSADAGISGANFAVAESGSIAIFTNEGNGRMVTTLPRLHVAVFTVEKLLPTLADLVLMIRLLPRAATGQPLSSYLSILTGPRKPGETSGPDELHIVILDNGRSDILQGPFRDILKCIRCSACLNVCPVYRVVGGHAYGTTYPGPMGIVLSVLLDGMARTHPLLDASTLCGACEAVCPVRVPLTRLIRDLRAVRVKEGLTPLTERIGMEGFELAVRRPGLFAWAQRAVSLVFPLLKSLGSGGVIERLPTPKGRAFHRVRGEERQGGTGHRSDGAMK